MDKEPFRRSKSQGALEAAVLIGVIVLAFVVGPRLANRSMRSGTEQKLGE